MKIIFQVGNRYPTKISEENWWFGSIFFLFQVAFSDAFPLVFREVMSLTLAFWMTGHYFGDHGPFGKGPTTPSRGLTITMAINHLLNGMILQVLHFNRWGSGKDFVDSLLVIFPHDLQRMDSYHPSGQIRRI